MNDSKYSIGQRVKVVTVSGHDPEMDRLLGALAEKRGEGVKSYCIGRDEMPDRIKMVIYPDYVYSYDIRQDNGDILRGLPEVALEPDISSA